MYVKNHQIHVKKKSGMYFYQNKIKKTTSNIIQKKNPTSKNIQDFGYWGIGGGIGGELIN